MGIQSIYNLCHTQWVVGSEALFELIPLQLILFYPKVLFLLWSNFLQDSRLFLTSIRIHFGFFQFLLKSVEVESSFLLDLNEVSWFDHAHLEALLSPKNMICRFPPSRINTKYLLKLIGISFLFFLLLQNSMDTRLISFLWFSKWSCSWFCHDFHPEMV